jgi:hypothetical protein
MLWATGGRREFEVYGISNPICMVDFLQRGSELFAEGSFRTKEQFKG